MELFVITDWDEGFALPPEAEALADVPSGGEYVVECVASTHSGMLHSVTVRGFTLDRLYGGDRFATVVDAFAVLRATLQTAKGWRVVEVHTGSAPRALAPSCPTCDSPERDVRRLLTCDHQGPCPHRGPQYTPAEAAAIAKETGHYPPNTAWEIVTGKAAPSGMSCSDVWHEASTKPARASVVHAPKLARTTHEGPGNATLVRGCSCGAEAPTPEAFATHVGVPERVFVAMLGLVGVIYDLCDYPAMVTHEEAASRVARCLEFPSC